VLAPSQKEKSVAPVRKLPVKPGLQVNRASDQRALSAIEEAKTWFILLNGQRYGPCTFTALVHMAEIGVVDADTGVWCAGWAKWRAATSIPELPQEEPYDLSVRPGTS
jgi:hypothetical protein